MTKQTDFASAGAEDQNPWLSWLLYGCYADLTRISDMLPTRCTYMSCAAPFVDCGCYFKSLPTWLPRLSALRILQIVLQVMCHIEVWKLNKASRSCRNRILCLED